MVYYPGGGWDDFRGSFDTLEEAYSFLTQKKIEDPLFLDWYHVVDSETGEKLEFKSV